MNTKDDTALAADVALTACCCAGDAGAARRCACIGVRVRVGGGLGVGLTGTSAAEEVRRAGLFQSRPLKKDGEQQ